MVRLFIDVETYSPGQRPTYDDKIIAIAYKTEGKPVTVLKEWESDEKTILTQLIDDVKRLNRPSIIGHNALQFDLPLIVNRATTHGIAPTGELMHLLLDSYNIDTIQVQLPQNNFSFSGLGLAKCAKRIGIDTTTCPGSEILARYEEGDYTAITEHIIEDVLTTEKLFYHLEQST